MKALVTLLIEHFNSKNQRQQFISFAINFLPPYKTLSNESAIGAAAILPRDSRIMMIAKGWLSLKRFLRFLALWQGKDAEKMWKRSGNGLGLMGIAHDS